MERLSSGLRINSAKDDAAGQAIANRMSAQITGLATAQRNANDGISVAQTAEGGLNQINDNLQRIRELSVQAENGTNSSQDLDSIQNEINQRLEEIDRISRETDFNGTKVLGENTDGTDPTKRTISIQVGSQDGQAIEVKLEQINRQTLGLEGFNVNGSGEVANRAADVEALVLNGFEEIGTRPNGAVEYAKTETVQNDATTVDDLLAAAALQRSPCSLLNKKLPMTAKETSSRRMAKRSCSWIAQVT
jgi:flagellin